MENREAIYTITDQYDYLKSKNLNTMELINFKTGQTVEIDFSKVECYRGTTLQNGNDGTNIYYKDGSEVLLSNKFMEVMEAEELLNPPSGTKKGWNEK